AGVVLVFAERIAGRSGVSVRKSLVERQLQRVIARPADWIEARDTLELGIHSVLLTVRERRARNEQRRVDLPSRRELVRLGADVGGRDDQTANQFALNADVPLLGVPGREIVRIRRHAHRPRELVGGARLRRLWYLVGIRVDLARIGIAELDVVRRPAERIRR